MSECPFSFAGTVTHRGSAVDRTPLHSEPSERCRFWASETVEGAHLQQSLQARQIISGYCLGFCLIEKKGKRKFLSYCNLYSAWSKELLILAQRGKPSLILTDPKTVGMGGVRTWNWGSKLEPGYEELELHFKAMKSFPRFLCRELTQRESTLVVAVVMELLGQKLEAGDPQGGYWEGPLGVSKGLGKGGARD